MRRAHSAAELQNPELWRHDDPDAVPVVVILDYETVVEPEALAIPPGLRGLPQMRGRQDALAETIDIGPGRLHCGSVHLREELKADVPDLGAVRDVVMAPEKHDSEQIRRNLLKYPWTRPEQLHEYLCPEEPRDITG